MLHSSGYLGAASVRRGQCYKTGRFPEWHLPAPPPCATLKLPRLEVNRLKNKKEKGKEGKTHLRVFIKATLTHLQRRQQMLRPAKDQEHF